MNAFYLMLSTFIVSLLGFVFWVIVTRTYDVPAVGMATTLLSVSGLLSLLGLAGFDTTFVRFLPGATRKGDYLNSGLLLVTVASAALSALAALLLSLLSGDFSILGNGWAWTAFVFVTVVTSLVTLLNSVFLAFKKAGYILMANVLLSGVKVALPLFVVNGDAMTIFTLVGGAQLVALVFGLVYVRRKFGHVFRPTIHLHVLRVVKKFSASMYVSSILNLLPPTVLPIVIVYHAGAENAAYYYIAFTVANAVYTIAYASMQSAFAEGSHNQAALTSHFAKATKLIAILLLPAALALALLSHVILEIFGPQYAQQASGLLQLFAVAAVPVALYSALGAVFKVTKNLRGAICMNIVYAAVILGAAYLLVNNAGLIAIGYAWLAGNLAACAVGAYCLLHLPKRRIHGETTHTRR